MSRLHLPPGTTDRLRVSLRVAGQSDRLFGTPDSDAQSWRARHAQHAWLSEGQKSHVHSRFHVGDVRRSPGASAKGRLLGQRESYRAARRLRRSETIRRSHHHGLPPVSPRGHANRSHLQHVRSADALARRPRGASVYRASPQRPTTQRIWRRVADALILLRVRFDRWHFQARDERFPRAGQPRQSARDDH